MGSNTRPRACPRKLINSGVRGFIFRPPHKVVAVEADIGAETEDLGVVPDPVGVCGLEPEGVRAHLVHGVNGPDGPTLRKKLFR